MENDDRDEHGREEEGARDHEERDRRPGERRRSRLDLAASLEVAVELVAERGRRGEAARAVVRDRVMDDRLERRRDARNTHAERRGLALEDLPREERRRGSLVGTVSAQALVEDDSERVDVGAPVHVPRADELLGRHVVRGPQDLARPREALVRPRVLGEPEVRDPRATRGRVEDHVRGLEVPVDAALGVRGGDGVGEVAREPRRARGFEGAPLEELLERLALAERHDVEGGALHVAHVHDLHDARVVDPRGEARLLLEAQDGLAIGEDAPVHDLEREEAVEVRASRHVDGSHGATTQLPDDLVLTDPHGGTIAEARRLEQVARTGSSATPPRARRRGPLAPPRGGACPPGPPGSPWECRPRESRRVSCHRPGGAPRARPS